LVKRVLLADDDPCTREVVAEILRDMGLEVVTSDDGGRMLVAIASQYKSGNTPEDVQLVVTDVVMPVMSGLDVLKGLRAAHWKTPVIVMTAFATDDVRDAVQKLGGVLLVKPVDIGVLEMTVRDLISRAA
jgi:two-component system OmpR family response regulator